MSTDANMSSLSVPAGLQTTFADLPDDAKRSLFELSNRNFDQRALNPPQLAELSPGAVPPLPVLVGVAQGDSWFDYTPAFFEDPFSGDLLGHLHRTGHYNIFNSSTAGDTLENMSYGTAVAGDGSAKPPEIGTALDAVTRVQASFYLLSAGGNDMAGSNGVNLEFFLNHALTNLPPLRDSRVIETFTVFNRAALSFVVDMVKAAKPGIEIFIHGYDYAIPDGRPVFKAPFGWNFIGPWLLPAFERQRIGPASARQAVIKSLIDKHNETIAALATADPQVHHIDCRGVLESNTTDWANELHPTAKGFGKIATKFDQVIQAFFRAKLVPPVP
jgi:GDSL-like Lipase/Acylhydrolase family